MAMRYFKIEMRGNILAVSSLKDVSINDSYMCAINKTMVRDDRLHLHIIYSWQIMIKNYIELSGYVMGYNS